MYDLPTLESALANTIFAGNLHFAAVTDSTSNDALAAARTGAPHGSVWFADEQRAGRGRGNHTWRSAAGDGLYVSVLLRLRIPPQRLLLLPMATALAAAQAIRTVAGVDADLRWPNDLLIGPAKVSGMMVESGSTAASAPNPGHFAVVGIGINVHQRSFDPGLATPATSLDQATGLHIARTISRQPLLIALLRGLEHEADSLAEPASAATIPARVEAASTWVRGRTVEVHGPQACHGVTAGLDEHGFLLVDTPTGRVTVQTGGLRSPGIH